MAEAPVVRLRDVTKSYGEGNARTQVLRGVSFELHDAETVSKGGPTWSEETAELRLGLPHVVRLEARPANAEGQGAVGVRDLVRTALRMRPDRLIVGEVRGPEVLDMLQALNTGHGGSCTTLHANGAAEALHRLEALAVLGGGELPIAAVRAHLAAAIDLVVVVERGPHGRRRVREIAEVSPPGTRIGVSACWTRGGGLVALRRRRPRLEGC